MDEKESQDDEGEWGDLGDCLRTSDLVPRGGSVNSASTIIIYFRAYPLLIGGNLRCTRFLVLKNIQIQIFVIIYMSSEILFFL